jgi:hypothetical protein
MTQGLPEQLQLVELLHREREPRPQLLVERILALEVDRHVEQRAGRREPEPLAQPRRERLEPVERAPEVGPPHVAPVDDAERQDLVGRHQVHERQDAVAIIDRVDVQAGHRQVGGEPGVLPQLAEVGGHQQLRPAGLELVVGEVEGVLPVGIELRDEDRLVHLDPLGAVGRQRVEQLRVGIEQAWQQREPVGAVARLADREVGEWPDEHGLGPHPLRPRLRELPDEPRGVQPELRVRAELGDDVVVVRVEPLRHLAGGHGAAAVGAITRGRSSPRHPEDVVERIAVKAPHPRGQVAQGEAHVEHLVVEREVAHRHEVEAGLLRPVATAQRRAHGEEILAGGFAAPVGLEGELQFAPGADAGKAEVVKRDHGDALPGSDRGGPRGHQRS